MLRRHSPDSAFETATGTGTGTGTGINAAHCVSAHLLRQVSCARSVCCRSRWSCTSYHAHAHYVTYARVQMHCIHLPQAHALHMGCKGALHEIILPHSVESDSEGAPLKKRRIGHAMHNGMQGCIAWGRL